MIFEPNYNDYLVLICDDESSIREMLTEALQTWGFQVMSAANGEEALLKLEQGKLPHIVLTDIMMGGITGIELAKKVKQISPEIECIIMTSHGSFDTAVEALRIGVHDYLTKPFDNLDDVKSTLNHVCERIYMRYYTEYLVVQMKKKNEDISLLNQMSLELAQNLDFKHVLEIGSKGFKNGFNYDSCLFYEWNAQQQNLQFCCAYPHEFSPPNLNPITVELGENEVLSQETIQKISNELNTEHLSYSVLKDRNGLRGVFVGVGRMAGDLSEKVLSDQYLRVISTALENAELHGKVVEASIRDGLTGLFNVRHFKELAQRELMKSKRLKHPMSLLFFDVDHFKKYNDGNGHQAGDDLLRQLGEILRATFRKTDIVARYGGEEFTVLLPHTPFADALMKADALREQIQKTAFAFAEKQPLGFVSVSIGVVEYPTHGNELSSMIEIADQALYAAKRTSRNVVEAGVVPEGYIAEFESQRVTKPVQVTELAATPVTVTESTTEAAQVTEPSPVAESGETTVEFTEGTVESDEGKEAA